MQAQALEDILQRLEDKLACGQDEVEVCINCWDEDPCGCAEPRHWPLPHAVGKIRSMLGFEGYTLLP